MLVYVSFISSDTGVSNISADTSRVYLALEEIMADVLSNLHDIQKSLEFWQSRAEVNQSINTTMFHVFFT
ncbi:unnamed protein product [Brassica oleracea]